MAPPVRLVLACAALLTLPARGEPVKHPPGKPNHLAPEKSLYLQQHAHNPVDWYPWGDEAIAKARREDKPILVSIGYSTCHWCHVMERESFVDPAVAKLLNEHFVAIKVDREERPDVDQIYMSAVQATGQGGGWPLNVFLTPELKPFHGGTYSPRDRFLHVISTISEMWKKDRGSISLISENLTKAVREINAMTQRGKLDRTLMGELAANKANIFDSKHGGFGRAPKFPPAMVIRILLRNFVATGHATSRDMAERTLDGMWRGGMYDHVAGGFHRYSTDNRWLVPHFEKMLYDNALLATAYLEAYQATGNPRWAAVGREILDYVLRDMRHPRGAFHAATDADSEGEEGRFFVWTPREIDAVLGKDGVEFARIYDVTPAGNFEHGASILNLPRPLEDWARELKTDLRTLEERLAVSRKRLHAAREKRVHPARDEKVVTAWAALMASAFCTGAQVLDEPRYRDAAVAAGEFLFRELVHGDHVSRRWIDGHRGMPGALEDYSFLLNMSIDLYETTFDPVWLDRALALADAIDARFWDKKGGGFFSAEPRPDLLVTVKDSYDGATPAGSNMAVVALARLAELTDRPALRQRAELGADAVAGLVKRAPHAFPHILLALDYLTGEPYQIVVAGDPASGQAKALWRTVHAKLLPARVLAAAGGPGAAKSRALIPLLEGKEPLDGKATAFVCRKKVCKLPVEDPAKLAVQLAPVK